MPYPTSKPYNQFPQQQQLQPQANQPPNMAAKPAPWGSAFGGVSPQLQNPIQGQPPQGQKPPNQGQWQIPPPQQGGWGVQQIQPNQQQLPIRGQEIWSMGQQFPGQQWQQQPTNQYGSNGFPAYGYRQPGGGGWGGNGYNGGYGGGFQSLLDMLNQRGGYGYGSNPADRFGGFNPGGNPNMPTAGNYRQGGYGSNPADRFGGFNPGGNPTFGGGGNAGGNQYNPWNQYKPGDPNRPTSLGPQYYGPNSPWGPGPGGPPIPPPQLGGKPDLRWGGNPNYEQQRNEFIQNNPGMFNDKGPAPRFLGGSGDVAKPVAAPSGLQGYRDWQRQRSRRQDFQTIESSQKENAEAMQRFGVTPEMIQQDQMARQNQPSSKYPYGRPQMQPSWGGYGGGNAGGKGGSSQRYSVQDPSQMIGY